MTAKTALLGLLLLGAALSGCLGGGAPKTTDDASSSPPGGSSTATTGTAPTTPTTSPPPVAPMANLTADLVNGTVPLRVNFTLADAAGSGAELSWILELGDGNSTNGTSLPANVSHAYEAVGNFVVNLTIASEAGDSNASLLIVAEPARIVLQRETGAWTTGASYGCAADPIAYPGDAPTDGVNLVEFAVAAATIGKSYKLTFTQVAEPAVGVYLSFYDADGLWLERNDADSFDPLTGTVPADAATAVVAPCNAGAGALVYEAGVNL